MRSSLWLMSFAAALCIPVSAQAVTITNVTTNTTVFFDDFEGVSPVSTSPFPDNSDDYDPVAVTSAWGIVEENASIVQVTSSTTSPDPGPFQGSNYVRLYRDETNQGNEIYANLSIAPSSGDVIRLSTMVYLGTDTRARAGIILEATPGDYGTAKIFVFPDPATGTIHSRSPGDVEYDTLVPYTAATWQRWDLEYAIDASTFSLTIGANSASGLPSLAVGTINDARLFNGNPTPGGSVYFDAVPGSNPVVPGDFDADGDVDGADFVVWQTHFPTATGATLADGDADNDGDVDGADFVVWQTNFPFTPSPAVAPVPEPAGITLISAAACILFGLCRKDPTIAADMK